jgi:hypothetical protein
VTDARLLRPSKVIRHLTAFLWKFVSKSCDEQILDINLWNDNMRVQSKLVVSLLALTGFMTSNVAQAACWDSKSIDAAQVKYLDVALKNATQRCAASNPALKADYQHYVQASGPTRARADGSLKSFFVRAGDADGFNSYNKLVAKQKPATGEMFACADMASILRSAVGEGASITGLAELATSLEIKPTLTGTACPATFAQAQ